MLPLLVKHLRVVSLLPVAPEPVGRLRRGLSGWRGWEPGVVGAPRTSGVGVDGRPGLPEVQSSAVDGAVGGLEHQTHHVDGTGVEPVLVDLLRLLLLLQLDTLFPRSVPVGLGVPCRDTGTFRGGLGGRPPGPSFYPGPGVSGPRPPVCRSLLVGPSHRSHDRSQDHRTDPRPREGRESLSYDDRGPRRSPAVPSSPDPTRGPRSKGVVLPVLLPLGVLGGLRVQQ